MQVQNELIISQYLIRRLFKVIRCHLGVPMSRKRLYLYALHALLT